MGRIAPRYSSQISVEFLNCCFPSMKSKSPLSLTPQPTTLLTSYHVRYTTPTVIIMTTKTHRNPISNLPIVLYFRIIKGGCRTHSGGLSNFEDLPLGEVPSAENRRDVRGVGWVWRIWKDGKLTFVIQLYPFGSSISTGHDFWFSLSWLCTNVSRLRDLCIYR